MRREKSPNSEQGFALFIVAAWLTLCLFVGLAVDLGIVFRYRRAMQNACDSGVLDGGRNLKASPSTVVSDTKSLASYDMTQNNINWDSLTAQTLDANGAATTINPVQDRANIHATVPTFFLSLVTPSIGVAIECTARIVPVTVTGLQPVGMNYSQWVPIWTQLQNTPCPLIGTPTSQMTPTQQRYCVDTQLTIGVNNTNNWGSGNTGTLDMSNPTTCSGNGASNWACTFENGTGPGTGTPPPPYCANQLNTSTNPPSGVTPWPACSVAQTKPGVSGGSAQGNTGIKGGVSTMCATPNPLSDPVRSKWIILLPLLDPSIWAQQGNVNGRSQPIDIVGFTAFELDCPAMGNGSSLGNGNSLTILGQFVSILDLQAVNGCIPNGSQNQQPCVDTGLYVVRLVE